MHGLPPPAAAAADAVSGSVSRRDLIALGYPRWTVDRWVHRGLLERTGRGEFRVRGSDHPLRQVLATTLWRAGEHARIGGALNCALRGLAGFPLSATDHIIVPPQRRVRGVPFVVVRTPVPPEDEDRILDLPAVTATRALIGAAATHRPAKIRAAFDSARRAGLTDAATMSRRLEALGNAYGAPQMRTIMRDGALTKESEPERDLAAIFRPGDPRPAVQVWMCWRGRWFRFDFAFVEARLAVEYDSAFHDGRREQDAERDLAMMELDIVTIRVTRSMMRDPEDARRRILAVRARRLELQLPPIVPQVPPWL